MYLISSGERPPYLRVHSLGSQRREVPLPSELDRRDLAPAVEVPGVRATVVYSSPYDRMPSFLLEHDVAEEELAPPMFLGERLSVAPAAEVDHHWRIERAGAERDTFIKVDRFGAVVARTECDRHWRPVGELGTGEMLLRQTPGLETERGAVFRVARHVGESIRLADTVAVRGSLRAFGHSKVLWTELGTDLLHIWKPSDDRTTSLPPPRGDRWRIMFVGVSPFAPLLLLLNSRLLAGVQLVAVDLEQDTINWITRYPGPTDGFAFGPDHEAYLGYPEARPPAIARIQLDTGSHEFLPTESPVSVVAIGGLPAGDTPEG